MTNSPLDIIHERRDQIETSLAHLAEQMAALRAEMQELVVAERTITRLIASASGHAPGVGRASAEGAVAEPQAPPSAQAAARSNLKIPDLIMMALSRMQQRGLRGAEPKEVQAEIVSAFGLGVSGINISTSMWRMAQPRDGRLTKDGPLYRIADKNEAADLLSLNDRSAASDHQPEQGREAGPGGGT